MKIRSLSLLMLLLVCAVAYLSFSGAITSYASQGATIGEPGVSWPPVMGESYPDLVLKDHTGKDVRLSGFKGKVLLIEPIGMNCPACNAFVGGNAQGGFNGTTPQQGLDTIESYFKAFVRDVDFYDPEIIHIHLLLYDWSMNPPDSEDAKAWAEHFKLLDKPNTYVLAGGKELVNSASYNMIPGFQLVDKEFILRGDSTGHYPKEGLDSLLGKVKGLLKK